MAGGGHVHVRLADSGFLGDTVHTQGPVSFQLKHGLGRCTVLGNVMFDLGGIINRVSEHGLKRTVEVGPFTL